MEERPLQFNISEFNRRECFYRFYCLLYNLDWEKTVKERNEQVQINNSRLNSRKKYKSREVEERKWNRGEVE